jgi:hypothetical protein
MQAKNRPGAAGTAEATPQGKMMNPSRLRTGKAVVKTANAKAKNRRVAVDPLATKRTGGSTTVNTKTTERDGCEHCGGRHSSKDCWELPEN